MKTGTVGPRQIPDGKLKKHESSDKNKERQQEKINRTNAGRNEPVAMGSKVEGLR